MIKDFQNWYLENSEFLAHLREHDSVLFSHIKHTLDSLLFMSDLKKEDVDEDVDEIFDAGFSYLFTYVNELQVYLKNYFQNNFHQFLEYERLIQYLVYTNDLKAILVDELKYNDIVREEFEYILNDIENILTEKKGFSQETIDNYDLRMLSVVPSAKTYHTIPEIFVTVYDKLKI